MAKNTVQSKPPAPTRERFVVPDWWYFAFLGLVCFFFFIKVITGQAHFWEDLIYYDYPVRIFARDAILSGQFPHWNPYSFGGMPFFAALQTATLYPGNLLLSILPLDNNSYWYAIELMMVLHLFIAGVTMFLFVREFTLGRTAALFAGIAYMLCGFLVCHVIHSMILYVGAWIPLIMLMLLRGARSGRIGPFCGAGLILGCTIFAGQPQVTFYEFILLGSFSIYLLLEYRDHVLRKAGFLVVAFAVAGLVSMVQMLPAIELSGQSVRSMLTFEAASEGSMSLRHLFTFVVPKLYGGVSIGNELPFWLTDTFHSGYWTFWETTFYTGLPVLLLGLISFAGIRRSKLVWFAAVWGAASLIVAAGNFTPVFHLLFAYVPGFDKFRIPSRVLFSWDVLLPLLAAMTLESWLDHARFRKLFPSLMIGCGIVALIALAAAAGIVGSIWPDFSEPGRLAFAQKQGAIALTFAALLAITLFLYYRKSVSYRTFKTCLVGLLLADLFAFGFGMHTGDESAPQHYERNSQAANFFKQESRKNLIRIKMREGGAMFLERNQGMIDKTQLLEGYAQLNLLRKLPLTTPARQLDLMNVKYAITVDYQSRSMGLAENATMLPRARLCYRTRVIADDTLLKQTLSADSFDYRRTVILDAKPSLPLAEDTTPVNNAVRISAYRDNSIDLAVNTEKNGMLVLSEIWYPAWQATVDGKSVRVFRADGCLRAVEVPAGEHSVSFRYRSKPFDTGLLISIITILLAFVLIGIDLAKRRDFGRGSAPKTP